MHGTKAPLKDQVWERREQDLHPGIEKKKQSRIIKKNWRGRRCRGFRKNTLNFKIELGTEAT